MVDADSKLLKVALLPAGYDVQRTALGDKITFGPWGQATVPGYGFVIYNSKDGLSGDSTRTICVSSGGRIRVQKGSSCD
jgi:Tfp pilus assembly protein FimT